MSILSLFPGADIVPLNHSLVQSTPSLMTFCTQVCASLLEKLVICSVFCTDVEIDEDAIGTVDSELVRPRYRPAGKYSRLQVLTRESRTVFAVLLAVYVSDVLK